MSAELETPVSPISDATTPRENDMQAVRMQRVDTPTAINVSSPLSSPSMPPWLREAVAQRKRQLAESRALDAPETNTEDDDDALYIAPPSRLTQQHFGIPPEERDTQHHFVSQWLSGLPEKLTEGWETVLREEVQEAFVDRGARRRTRESRNMVDTDQSSAHDERRQTFFEDLDSEDFDFCPGVAPIADDYSSAEDDENDDEFLVKVLLGRKRLMQAEISVKRLKMGLKHITNGICGELTNITDTDRTRELLAEVDNTFEEVVRKRLSNATAIRKRADNNDEQKQRYRRRLQAMRNKDPGFILQVYTEREIKELKTMVSDILGMDEGSGDGEGTDWFWNMLPRLLELRGDMAEAEREFARQRKAAKRCQSAQQGASYAATYDKAAKRNRRSTLSHYHQSFIAVPLSVWDLYYHQYIWMQTALNFRPIGSWYAFSIPVEDELETTDWELRIEQRVWLQEHFSLTLGTKRWLPFRQAMIEV